MLGPFDWYTVIAIGIAGAVVFAVVVIDGLRARYGRPVNRAAGNLVVDFTCVEAGPRGIRPGMTNDADDVRRAAADQLQLRGPVVIDWLLEQAELAYGQGDADAAATWCEIADAAMEMLRSWSGPKARPSRSLH